MTSNEVSNPKTQDTENNGCADSPTIGVLVTADVHVTRYSDSCSDIGGDNVHKCTIVTSLNAIIQQSSTPELEREVIKENKPENLVKELQTQLTKECKVLATAEDFELPLVRKSKKHTQLNNANFRASISFHKRSQIDRIVLLPFLGCTTLQKPSKPYKAISVKSSKSWEIVKVIDRYDKLKKFQSHTFVRGKPIKNFADNFLSCDKNRHIANPKTCLKEKGLPDNLYTNVEKPVRTFYLIKNSSSSSGVSIESNGNKIKRIKPLKRLENKQDKTKPVYSNKQDLHNNLMGFEGEIFRTSPKVGSKTTRNVSVLHRPKTRDKATSTTTLQKDTTFQNQKDLIQDFLTPYISVDGNFPSEIVLKLVPKKEALQSRIKNDPEGDARSVNSSELNLLAPTLNTTTVKAKKKKGSGLLSCLPFMKKDEKEKIGSNSTISCDSKKEVYFPSIVEVHNKKSRKPKEIDSGVNISNMNESLSYEKKTGKHK